MMAMLEDFCDLFRAVPVFDAFDLEVKVVGAHRGDHAKKADRHEGNQTGAASGPAKKHFRKQWRPERQIGCP